MSWAPVLVAALVAALLLVASAGASNSSDKSLARKLVVAKSDIPVGMIDTGGGLRPGQCLPRHGFVVTARATAPFWGTPFDGFVDSVAAVLKTREEARVYYSAVVRAISTCLAGQWRRGGSESAPLIGSERALPFPHLGDQSVAARLPLDFKHGNSVFHKYTFDWVVVRKHRAVLVDDFLSPAASTSAHTGLRAWAKGEPRIVDRELARTFGN